MTTGTYYITELGSFEHETILGRFNSAVLIDPTHVLLAYNGNPSCGYLKTFDISDPENIFELDFCIHDNNVGVYGGGRYNSLISIDSTHFGLICTNGYNIGHLLTIEISPTYIISIKDDLTVEDENGYDLSMLGGSLALLDSTHLVMASSYSVGFFGLFSFDANYSITQVSIFEHAPSVFQSGNSLKTIDENNVILSYADTINNGYIRTFNIGEYHGVTITDTLSHGYDTSNIARNLEIINSTHFILAYANETAKVLKTFQINKFYVIEELKYLVYDSYAVTLGGSLKMIDSTHLTVVYSGSVSKIIETFKLDGSYAISSIASFPYDSYLRDGYESIIKNTLSSFTLAHTSTDEDGFIKIFNIDATTTVLPAFPGSLPAPLISQYGYKDDSGNVSRSQGQFGFQTQKQIGSQCFTEFNIGFIFTQAEMKVFEDFYIDDLIKGHKWFTMDLLVGAGYLNHNCRLTKKYQANLISNNNCQVGFVIETDKKQLISETRYVEDSMTVEDINYLWAYAQGYTSSFTTSTILTSFEDSLW